MASDSGEINTTKVGNKVKGYQHIDNGGATYTFDKELKSLTINTSYFGYGHSEICIPFVNVQELKKFLDSCEDQLSAKVCHLTQIVNKE